jgi:magnesium-transporting ATPase (P-type)
VAHLGHQQHRSANSLRCPALRSLCAGSTTDIKWSGVKVGQVLKVMSDEDIPADLLTLYCHLDDNVCFIKTTNLDGEWVP